MDGDERARGSADAVARRSYGKLVAYLAARTGDVAAAEDALSEAFVAALANWPRQGCPSNPEAWLLTVARRKLIDFVSNLSDRELEFTGVHEPLGDVTILDTLEEILLQDQGNLGLVRDLIVAYHKSAPQGAVDDEFSSVLGVDPAQHGAAHDANHDPNQDGGAA